MTDTVMIDLNNGDIFMQHDQEGFLYLWDRLAQMTRPGYWRERFRTKLRLDDNIEVYHLSPDVAEFLYTVRMKEDDKGTWERDGL